MSEFPHEIFIHGPGDLGQSVFHHEPHDGYVANVKYIRADLAAEREAELVECLQWYAEQSRLCRLIHSEGDAGRDELAKDGGERARAILAQFKPEGAEET